MKGYCKKIITLLTVLTLLCCNSFFLCACGTSYEGKLFYTSEFFSTYCEMGIYDYFDSQNTQKAQNLWEEVKQILAEISLSADTQNPNSDIYKYNKLSQGESIRINNTTADMVRVAISANRETQGAYNCAVYSLCDLWGFSSRFSHYGNEQEYLARIDGAPYDLPFLADYLTQTPDQKYIDAFVQLCDTSQEILSGNENNGFFLTKHCPSVNVDGVTYSQQIDLGALAKGYAVDKVRALLADKGYENGYFSCGNSSILALCRPEKDSFGNITNQDYSISLASPRIYENSGQTFATISLQNTLVTTSGDYRLGKYRLINGLRYCHIINPSNGNSLNNSLQDSLSSVTLVGGNGAMCDALSTALMVMGQNALSWLEEKADSFGLKYILTFSFDDHCKLVSNMQKEDISLADNTPYYRFAYSIDDDGLVHYEK